MRLIYTPEDGEKREWDFHPQRLMSPDAEALEAAGGDLWQSLDEFGTLFLKGNRRAYRAALWVMLRAENPKLRFEHLVIRADEVDWQLDDDEQARLDAALADPDLDGEQREQIEPRVRQVVAEGKDEAPSPSGEPGTAST